MASDRDRNIYDMLVRILAFNTAHAADYAAVPAAAANFTIVQDAKDALDEFFAKQTSGEASAAVSLKSVRLAAARRKMVRFSRTARALNLDTPGFNKLFKVPNSNNEGELVAAGREFVKEATTHSAEFMSLGLPATLKTQLAADLDAIEDANTTKAEASGEKVGATAGIENQTRLGLEAAEVLNAIMRNVYDDDPVKYAEWKTARHVKRANQTADEPAPPPDL